MMCIIDVITRCSYIHGQAYLTMVWTKSVVYLRCPKYLTMVISLVPHAYTTESRGNCIHYYVLLMSC